jgi:hypothetical protein
VCVFCADTKRQGLVLRLGGLAQLSSTVLVSRQLQGRAHALQATIATSVVRHLMVCNALPVTTALAVQQKSPFAQQLLEATVMEPCRQHRKGFRVQKDSIVPVALQTNDLVLHIQAATVLQEPVGRRVSSAWQCKPSVTARRVTSSRSRAWRLLHPMIDAACSGRQIQTCCVHIDCRQTSHAAISPAACQWRRSL